MEEVSQALRSWGEPTSELWRTELVGQHKMQRFQWSVGKDISPVSAKLAWGLGLPSYIPTVLGNEAQFPAEKKKYKSYIYTTEKQVALEQ